MSWHAAANFVVPLITNIGLLSSLWFVAQHFVLYKTVGSSLLAA
jgi:hypothetical protein